MQSITGILLWIIAAGTFAQSGTAPASFDELLSAARQAQTKEDYAAAADYYRRAVLLASNIPELWANLGLMQDATGDYSDAVASFQKAERLNPSLYVPNLFLGLDYVHLNRMRDAIPFLGKAETLNSSDPQPRLALGRAYYSLGDFDAAQSAYQRAVALDARNSSAWYGVGMASLGKVERNGRKLAAEEPNSAYSHALFAESLEEQGRFKEATTEARLVLTADPHFLCAHARLGVLYLDQHQTQEAAREFDSEAQGCALAGLGHAQLSLEVDDLSDALSLLKRLWTQDRGFVQANLSFLVDRLETKRKDKLAEFVSRQDAAAIIPPELSASLLALLRGLPQKEPVPADFAEGQSTNARPNIAAAEMSARAGRYARCVGYLSNNYDRHLLLPTEGGAKLLLAECSFMTGDYALSAQSIDLAAGQSTHDLAPLYWSIKANQKLAFDAFSHFEQLAPDSAKTHLLLGDMYRRRQHLLDAENEYKAAAALAPNDPAPLYGLASAYSQDSKLDQALSTIEAALVMNPGDPDFNLLAGEILVGQHEWTRAVKYLKQSLSATPPLRPQMLPHAHVLLGKVYAQTDRPQEAVRELQLGLATDEDGSVYYQLARLYARLGNTDAARSAIDHVKALERKRRDRAVVAIQDSGSALSDLPE